MANQYANGHGRSSKSKPDRTYSSWTSMKTRCTNEKNKNYFSYGGRGITFCERWASFDNFLADMGERPEGMTLDRKDTNGNYEPSNCRWATSKEQMDNQRKTIYVACFGEKLTLADWSKRTGISKQSIRRRLERGIAPEIALTSPILQGYTLPSSGYTISTRGDEQ